MAENTEQERLGRVVADEVQKQVEPHFEAWDMKAEGKRIRALLEKWPPETPALAEPLREATRKLRRAVLGLSALVVAAVWAGLLPQRISVLGIDFTSLESSKLLALTAILLLFFLFEFTIYALSDLQTFLLQLEESEKGWLYEQMKRRHGAEWQDAYHGRDQIEKDLERIRQKWPTRRRLIIARGLVDFLLPMVLGVGTAAWAFVRVFQLAGGGT